MDISAVMNIQELAVNQAVKHQADAQDRQEKMNQQKEERDVNKAGALINKTHLEEGPGALSNAGQQQIDPQSTSIRVEKQVDVQAAKETVQGTDNKNAAEDNLTNMGTLLDIIT